MRYSIHLIWNRLALCARGTMRNAGLRHTRQPPRMCQWRLSSRVARGLRLASRALHAPRFSASFNNVFWDMSHTSFEHAMLFHTTDPVRAYDGPNGLPLASNRKTAPEEGFLRIRLRISQLVPQHKYSSPTLPIEAPVIMDAFLDDDRSRPQHKYCSHPLPNQSDTPWFS